MQFGGGRLIDFSQVEQAAWVDKTFDQKFVQLPICLPIPSFPKRWTFIHYRISATNLLSYYLSSSRFHNTVMTSERTVKSTMHDNSRFSNKQDLGQSENNAPKLWVNNSKTICDQTNQRQKQQSKTICVFSVCVGDKSKLGNIFWYAH